MKSVKPIDVTFHLEIVYHYLDKENGLNVMVHQKNKKFISGWKRVKNNIIILSMKVNYNE